MTQADEKMNIGSQLENIGWRQGSIINKDDFRTLVRKLSFDFDIPNEPVAVVITHSCDIACNSIEQFPFIDILVGQFIPQENPEFTYNKHPRILNTQILKLNSKQNIEQLNAEFYGYKTIRIDKNLFKSIRPDTNVYIESNKLYHLCSWLSGRTNRSAFPTNFNNRIAAADPKKKIRKKAKKPAGKDLTGIYLQIFPDEEINDSEVYNVNILGLVSEDFEGNIDEVKGLIDEYANIMKSCNMDVKSAVSKESEVSVALLRKFKRVNFDDLTIRYNSKLPPELDV